MDKSVGVNEGKVVSNLSSKSEGKNLFYWDSFFGRNLNDL
jgi:hypothetical protein